MPPPRELDRVYDDHAQALFAFLLNYTRHEADTRDILQQLFARLVSGGGIPLEVRDERGYLLCLANNLATDFFRRQGSRRRTLERLAPDLEIFAPSANPDESALRTRLGAALGELPPEQRAVIHLKLWEGLTFEQIAAALGISLNTAASRYRYGLDKLRSRLRPLYKEINDSGGQPGPVPTTS